MSKHAAPRPTFRTRVAALPTGTLNGALYAVGFTYGVADLAIEPIAKARTKRAAKKAAKARAKAASSAAASRTFERIMADAGF